MIKSFSCKQTQKLFYEGDSWRLPSNLKRVALRKLLIQNAACEINDLRVPPGNHLEKLKHDRKNQYSIRINDQFRICFEWIDDNACEVEIVDYHL